MATTESPNELSLDALRVVLDALAIPFPATVGDRDRYRQVREERTQHAVIFLENLLGRDHKPDDIAWSIGYLRDRLHENPPTGYTHYETQAGR